MSCEADRLRTGKLGVSPAKQTRNFLAETGQLVLWWIIGERDTRYLWYRANHPAEVPGGGVRRFMEAWESEEEAEIGRQRDAATARQDFLPCSLAPSRRADAWEIWCSSGYPPDLGQNILQHALAGTGQYGYVVFALLIAAYASY